MSKNTDIVNLSSDIIDLFEEYTEEVKEEINKTTAEHGKKLRDETVNVAKKKNIKRTGKYQRAISYKTEEGIMGDTIATVYVKAPHYRLAHLLEKGHAKANGVGRVAGRPHFGPALDKIEDEYIEAIKKVVGDD